jgi:hypothetical protein
VSDSDKHGVAQQAEAARGRRHEAGALAGLVDDLARRAHALGAVAVQQRHRPATLTTKASFQARFCASWKPVLAPRTPKIGSRCAASPQ